MSERADAIVQAFQAGRAKVLREGLPHYTLTAGECIDAGQFCRIGRDGRVYGLRDGDGFRSGDLVATQSVEPDRDGVFGRFEVP